VGIYSYTNYYKEVI